jgi:hypothetical protein
MLDLRRNLLQLTSAAVRLPPMNSVKKPLLFALLVVAFGSLFAGCVAPKSDSTIPWNRPAEWEGQIPGMTSNTVGR